MAQVLISLLPSFLTKYLYIVMGILGGPLGIIMGPDPYYYAVMPLVIKTVAPYGITAEQVAHAMLIGENVVLSVSPCVAANYLAFGLSGIELKEHMKFSFKWEWLVSILMLVFAISVACKIPGRIDGLVLSNTGPCSLGHGNPGFAAELKARFDDEPYIREFLRSCFVNPISKDMEDRLWEYTRRVTKEAAYEVSKSLRETDYRDAGKV